MRDRISKRIAQGNTEGGFTLIELLVVIIILGILLAIAVPSYIGFKAKAEKSAAAANVRAAVPAVEAFYADNGAYTNMSVGGSAASPPGLAYYDPASASKVVVQSSGANTYCITSTTGNSTYFKKDPAGSITEDPGPNVTDCNAAT
jgi:type IV pilus assembly protein PilA